jgi:hypothetical protein
MMSGTIVSLDDSAQACRRDRRLARRVQPSVLTCVGRASEQPFQFVAGLVTPGVRQPLQFAQVTRMDRAPGQQVPGAGGAFVQQFVQLAEIAARIGQVGQPVQGHLVALVGQRAQRVPVKGHVRHNPMLQPCLKGKVKREIIGT